MSNATVVSDMTTTQTDEQRAASARELDQRLACKTVQAMRELFRVPGRWCRGALGYWGDPDSEDGCELDEDALRRIARERRLELREDHELPAMCLMGGAIFSATQVAPNDLMARTVSGLVMTVADKVAARRFLNTDETTAPLTGGVKWNDEMCLGPEDMDSFLLDLELELACWEVGS